ncbi:FecR domain-containing protein [Devosia sp.]|uniref:FecR domain-containing protein n=1 Tax=Devosia sp. TaxID=1871048 RepID=UPI003F6E68F7
MLDRMLTLLLLVVAMSFTLASASLADDWVAVKLRGQVLQLVGGDWAKLQRGDVVPDDRVIRTLGNGRVDLKRDAEVISLGGNTQIQIKDRTGKRFTTVKQHFGTVEIEAEVRNVQHFAVETPFLAAVVKGTHFIVKSGKSEASVKVTRGQVEVSDVRSGAHVLVPAGQRITVTAAGEIAVTGRGAGSAQIVGPDGQVISSPAAGVNATVGVAGTNAGVGVGTSGVTVGVSTPVGVGVGAEVGGGGASVGVDVGGTNVGVSVGGGSGVSVNVGGAGVSLGLGGLL